MLKVLILLVLLHLAQSQTTCCNKKEIGGTGDASGSYWLEASNDTRCTDGCVYSKNNITDPLYCFMETNQYVINCSSEAKPIDIAEYWNIQSIIQPASITDRGTWGATEYCPVGSYGIGFDLYYATLCPSRCSTDDDSALMGISIYCAAYDDPTQAITATITSEKLADYSRSRGSFSQTARQDCPGSTFLYESQYLSELFIDQSGTSVTNFTCPTGIICSTITGPAYDPIGGMNLNMKCSDGTQLNGAAIPQSARPDTSSWSSWMICPVGTSVCGIQTKVYAGTGNSVDNLGNTAVIFTCCGLPPGFG